MFKCYYFPFLICWFKYNLYLCTGNKNIAKLAQLVEHFIRNERVAGSSPAFGSILKYGAFV